MICQQLDLLNLTSTFVHQNKRLADSNNGISLFLTDKSYLPL